MRPTRAPRSTPTRRQTATADRPPTIGLTGTIGAGKSAALEVFARNGAAVFDSDRVVHDLYRTPEVRDAVVARLGRSVLGADGSIDRAAVAAIVFADPAERAWLEGLIHPLVGAAFARWLEEAPRRVPRPVALVHEVALLFEGGLDDRYDRTLLVDAPDAVRYERVAARGRLEGLAAREARLLPVAEKRRLADDVIVNDGDLARLEAAVRAYLAGLA